MRSQSREFFRQPGDRASRDDRRRRTPTAYAPVDAASGRGASDRAGSDGVVATAPAPWWPSAANTGLVVTNWHVVRDATGQVEVVFPDGFRSAAKVLATDPDWDLAALGHLAAGRRADPAWPPRPRGPATR